VSVLQYRAKTGSPEEKLRTGSELKRLCADCGVTFIINDDLQLARSLDADGLHLGQEDGDPAEARMILGPGKIIGVSTHTLAEARRAESSGADYIGFGAMYPTTSKEIRHLPGPGPLAEIKAALGIPVAAIGGITRENAATVIDAGADAIAVISAVLSDRTPGVAAAELALAFNRRAGLPRGTVLSIAGSDSGGGAGLQADIKTITLLGSYAASVITAVTAQNSCGVSAVHGVPSAIVEEQLAAVLSDIPVDVVKTGMLFSGELTALVADTLRAFNRRIVVVDPVLTAKGGAPLLDRHARSILTERLFPVTYLLTPNIPEAEWLTGLTIRSVTEMEEAARQLHAMGVRNVLLKGGHLAAGDAVDILFDGNLVTRFTAPRVNTRNSHGTGCTYASAIAALLAQGVPLAAAVRRAKEFVTRAIRFALPLGKGHGPVNHSMAAKETGREDYKPELH
jgi:hydroxymethylpyrimidine kinase/phosphomethylpyrimidine kinase/thiamine-phosphate diphosphorylase